MAAATANTYTKAKETFLTRCSEQQVVVDLQRLIGVVKIERRPGERINSLNSLLNELENRLLLNADDEKDEETWKTFRALSKAADIDLSDVIPAPPSPVLNQEPSTQETFPSKELVQVLSRTFSQLLQSDLSFFLRSLGYEFKDEYKEEISLTQEEINNFMKYNHETRFIVECGLKCFWNKFYRFLEDNAYHFSMNEHIASLVEDEDYFNPPLNKLASEIRSLNKETSQ